MGPAAAAALLVLPLTAACASVTVRGIVTDESGRAIPDAAVVLRELPSSARLDERRTDERGCFELSSPARDEARRFRLEVSANGKKEMAADVPGRRPSTQLVMLAAADGEAASAVRPVAGDSGSRDPWETRCVSDAPAAATQVGIR